MDGYLGGALRAKLVDELRASGVLDREGVAAAFAAVPRHVFVPNVPLEQAYANEPVVTRVRDGGPSSSSSQPQIMAEMLDQLAPEPGQRILEIGAGTGYNAALLKHIVGDDGRVTTIDIQHDVAATARRQLQDSGNGQVRVLTGDGAAGAPDGAPFDGIIVTAGCSQIPPAWVDQLVDGGRLVLPLRVNTIAVTFAFCKHGDQLISDAAAPCVFMPLQGEYGKLHRFGEPESGPWVTDIDPGADLRELLDDLCTHPGGGRAVELDALTRYSDEASGVKKLFEALLWISLQGSPMASRTRRVNSQDWRQAIALLCPSDSALLLEGWPPSVEVHGGPAAVTFTEHALAAWQDAGEPAHNRLRARITHSDGTLDGLPRPTSGQYLFERGAHRYQLEFASNPGS